jgi:hypothetical protein
MKRGILLFLPAIILVFGIVAVAEEKFGVPVYPGAKFDSAVSQFLKESMSQNAACYRTNDGIQKVVEFYKRQKGLDLIGPEKGTAMFKRCKKEYNEYLKKEMSAGCDLDITIQNPWQDMKTGKLVNDTLISIVKTGEWKVIVDEGGKVRR